MATVLFSEPRNQEEKQQVWKGRCELEEGGLDVLGMAEPVGGNDQRRFKWRCEVQQAA